MKQLLFFFFLPLIPFTGHSCSAFKYVQGDSVQVAKNFDWFFGDGVLLTNAKNQSKCTYLDYGQKNTCWTSKYNSLTFNQNGKEFPYGGMNEKGLVVEMLWLKETNYKEDNTEATTISELEWIQYQLDNFESVEEVLVNLDQLNIDPFTATIHYFVVDQNGKSVVIEFIGGEAVVTVSTEDVQTITNGSNAFNQAFYTDNKSKFGDQYIPKKNASQLRYCSVKNNLEKWPSGNSFNSVSAFTTLGIVSEKKDHYKTFWTIHYDLKNRRILFKTFDNSAIRSIALSEIDFDLESILYYNLASGNTNSRVIDHMKEYTLKENLVLIETCIKPKLTVDFQKLNQHQLNPEKSQVDKVFSNNHMDVEVTIVTKKAIGSVKFFLSDTEINYRRQGPFGAFVLIDSNEATHQLYSLPKGKYAYGGFHDENDNGFIDRNFMKMPKEPYSFSGRKRFFFLPPKFEKATFELQEKLTIEFK